MKPAHTSLSFRHALGLAVAGAALLSAAGASAQTAPPPFYSFQVVNDTYSGGDPSFPVTDDLTFTNLQIQEVFADSFTQTISLGDLDTGQIAAESGAFYFDSSTPGTLSDPSHGALLSAVLTGGLDNGLAPGATQTLTLQSGFDPASATTQLVSSSFSASLFGPASSGVGIGQFSLLDGSGNPYFPTITINAAPVPEASSVVSLGLMLALGLGGLVITRRRRIAAN